ncbi:MAG: glycerol-3-phosphate acyltransferase PlsY [Parcubacteria group bacterium Athens0714_26]|nr:MAG: glycerol-3-phosphate acyltransferase PlsY [Parcubacteria group bacterium Athens0714_26]
MESFFLILLFSYLVGSIPFDYILVKIIKGIDIRKVGSGNPGATNVKRILGWPGLVAAFILDAFKGVVPVWLAWHVFNLPVWEVTLVGSAAIIGHILSIFLWFKGGKGVSTIMGVFLVLNPLIGGAALASWLFLYLRTGFSSAGSLLAALVIPVTQIAKQIFDPAPSLADSLPVTIFSFLVLGLIVYSHRENIGRLLNGTERKA